METIKNIAAIIGCVLSLITLISLCSKGGRAAIKSFFKQNTKELQDENERQAKDIKEVKNLVGEMSVQLTNFGLVLEQQCRDTIKNIYYKYYKERKLPLYERKTVDLTYKLYKDIWDGNTYIKLIYNEITKWEIDTISYETLSEE